MEGNASQLPSPTANFPHFSLTFRQCCTIKLIDCDQQCLTLIQHVVEANWPSGIQSQFLDYDGAFAIKFFRNPFSQAGSKVKALASKRMCWALLIALHSIGWELFESSDLSRTTDLTTWFFQKNPALIGKPLPADGGIVCLSLSSYDKLQLVNAPSYLHNELLQCVGPLLQNHELHGPDFEVKMLVNTATTHLVDLVVSHLFPKPPKCNVTLRSNGYKLRFPYRTKIRAFKHSCAFWVRLVWNSLPATVVSSVVSCLKVKKTKKTKNSPCPAVSPLTLTTAIQRND